MSCIGVILAGGLSSRMGEDKSQLLRGQKNMLQYTTGLLEKLGLEVVLSGLGGIEDVTPNAGPLVGIYSVLQFIPQQQPAEALLIVPVDMPLLTTEVLQTLLDAGEETELATCYEDCYLPLYLPITGPLKNYLDNLFGEKEADEAVPNKRAFSMKKLLSNIDSLQLPINDPEQLSNTNTPQEWQTAIRHLKEVQDAE